MAGCTYFAHSSGFPCIQQSSELEVRSHGIQMVTEARGVMLREEVLRPGPLTLRGHAGGREVCNGGLEGGTGSWGGTKRAVTQKAKAGCF